MARQFRGGEVRQVFPTPTHLRRVSPKRLLRLTRRQYATGTADVTLLMATGLRSASSKCRRKVKVECHLEHRQFPGLVFLPDFRKCLAPFTRGELMHSSSHWPLPT